MEWISISTIITTAVLAIGAVFCNPLYECFKTSVEAILDPGSLDDDSDKLKQLSKEIGVMEGSVLINKWNDDCRELMDQIHELWGREMKTDNDCHLSSCLCGDGCPRCSLRMKIRKMIARGQRIKRRDLQRETGEHIPDVSREKFEYVQLDVGRERVEHIQDAQVATEHIPDVSREKFEHVLSDVGQETVEHIQDVPVTTEHIPDVSREIFEHVQSDVGRETVEHIQDVPVATEHIPDVSPQKFEHVQSNVGHETVEHIQVVLVTTEHVADVPNFEHGTSDEKPFKRVMDALNDNNVWYIGVWGPGGVGKSTLVKALFNKMVSDSPFSLVRLIKLKENDGFKEVQEAIAESLGLNMGEGIEDRIHNTLQRQKFLLILDNVWKAIDLPTIGIRVEKQKGSKIILTTRSKRVCTQMNAKEIEMGYLTDDEAWQLFAEKAGEVTNDKRIKPLAKAVYKKCRGWPLALAVVGSAMKGRRDTDSWKNAIKDLQGFTPILSGLESEVYSRLKFGYDLLDDTLKSCLLYCSLYPEGYSIEINELVQCWLAENLIDEGLPYTEAYSRGLGLIKRLKNTCLLEQDEYGNDQEPKTVRMHDIVHDSARWIGKSTNRSIVISGHGIYLSPIFTLPEEAKNIQWISFVDNEKIKLPEYEKDYSNVTTLLLRGTSHNEKLEVSNEFLKGFRAVKVLNMEQVQLFDASRLPLKELRALILRKCSYIEKLTTATNLNAGRISGVVFDCGPAEIQSIAPKLRILEVGDSYDLKSLCKYESKEHWISLEILSVKNCPGLKKLPSMPSINEIRGSLEWWNKLEWDSEDIKLRMNQCFKPLD